MLAWWKDNDFNIIDKICRFWRFHATWIDERKQMHACFWCLLLPLRSDACQHESFKYYPQVQLIVFVCRYIWRYSINLPITYFFFIIVYYIMVHLNFIFYSMQNLQEIEWSTPEMLIFDVCFAKSFWNFQITNC